MNNLLSRRLQSLEQDQPQLSPVYLWRNYGEDADALFEAARAANPGRPVIVVGWLDPQEPQFTKQVASFAGMTANRQ